MGNKIKNNLVVLLLLTSLLAIGCAESGTQLTENFPDSTGGDIELPNPSETEIGKEASEASEKEYKKAVLMVNQISNDANSGVYDFEGLIDTSLLDALKDKLFDTMSPVLDKFAEVKHRITELQDKIRQEISLLDPNIPQHAKAIAELEKAIAKLEQAKAKIDNVITKIVEKLDYLNAKLDRLIDKIDAGNLLGLLIRMKIREIKDKQVGEIKSLLLALLLR